MQAYSHYNYITFIYFLYKFHDAVNANKSIHKERAEKFFPKIRLQTVHDTNCIPTSEDMGFGNCNSLFLLSSPNSCYTSSTLLFSSKLISCNNYIIIYYSDQCVNLCYIMLCNNN